MKREAESDDVINWEAVAKALGVSRDTLPVAASNRREVETADVVPAVVREAVRPLRQVAGDYALTDEEWGVLETLIPRGPGEKRGKQDRQFINACLYRQRTLGSGREWASSPEAVTIPLKSLQGRFYRWCMNGYWVQLAAAVEASSLPDARKIEFRAMAVEAVARKAKVLALRAS